MKLLDNIINRYIENTINKVVDVRFHSKSGMIPYKASDGAVCFDIPAYDEEHEVIVIQPRSRAILKTGIAFEIPDGYGIDAFARSGYSTNKGVIMGNGTAIIDTDFTGYIVIPIINTSDEEFIVNRHDRMAQIRLHKRIPVNFIQLDSNETMKLTSRGSKGLGSTGQSFDDVVIFTDVKKGDDL